MVEHSDVYYKLLDLAECLLTDVQMSPSFPSFLVNDISFTMVSNIKEHTHDRNISDISFKRMKAGTNL